MGRKLSAFLIAASLAATTTTLGAPPASAATWSVFPGGPFTGTGGPVVISDTSTGSQFTCQAVTVSGTARSGSGLSGSGLLAISNFSFTMCTGPLGITFTCQITQFGVQFDGTSYSAATGRTTGAIVNITLRCTGPVCSFTASGSAPATYDNPTGILRTGPGATLIVSNVAGCFGLFRNGDRLQLMFSVAISPRQTITSP